MFKNYIFIMLIIVILAAMGIPVQAATNTSKNNLESTTVRSNYISNITPVYLTNFTFLFQKKEISISEDVEKGELKKIKDIAFGLGYNSNSKMAVLYLNTDLRAQKNDTLIPPENGVITMDYLENQYGYSILNDKRQVLIGILSFPSETKPEGFHLIQLKNITIQTFQVSTGKDKAGKPVHSFYDTIHDRISMMKYMALEQRRKNTKYIGMLEIIDPATNTIAFAAIPGDQKSFLETIK